MNIEMEARSRIVMSYKIANIEMLYMGSSWVGLLEPLAKPKPNYKGSAQPCPNIGSGVNQVATLVITT